MKAVRVTVRGLAPAAPARTTSAASAVRSSNSRLTPSKSKDLPSSVSTADDLVGDRGEEEADGRADTRVGRDDDLADADLLGDPGRMQRAIAAEGDHDAVRQILALLDRVHARRVGHGLVDHLAKRRRRRR